MKCVFANVTNFVFLGKRVFEKQNQDGSKDLIYYVSVDSQDGFCSFPCTIDLFNSLGDLPKYTPINLAMEYDSYDRAFKVIKLLETKNN